jgi:hypothetical protein
MPPYRNEVQNGILPHTTSRATRHRRTRGKNVNSTQVLNTSPLYTSTKVLSIAKLKFLKTTWNMDVYLTLAKKKGAAITAAPFFV